ncbi:hypothetical protein LC048_09120 [Mesobacillus subterraneus]|uniref:hypothetical protein n=1 Tax=Mesobacillus subterraneus TaxID=285983 RepID=UPI001CFC4F58|nr:hypothetical protein [Mesobacillus subterraneus]WLR57007.1 hypothetical protein LC048_09120 [Mesobacillus subterraneus]
MRTGMRHSDYLKNLLEDRKNELRQVDPIHEIGNQITSPPGATSLEENKIIAEYLEQTNLHTLANAVPEFKKTLILKKFFKMKRNQEVIVYIDHQGTTEELSGKVNAIGRDFVILTNLKDRIWIPYKTVISANSPAGVPTYENTHQNFIYDNDLKRKLTTNFGETVAKRDVLIHQFFEESLRGNLDRWNGLWIKAITAEETAWGKIVSVSEESILLQSFNSNREIVFKDLSHLISARFINRVILMGKTVLTTLFR